MSDRSGPPPVGLMPAEWEPHDATWLSWPHQEEDWPDKLEAVRWVYPEMVRVLAESERVEILCRDEEVLADARRRLEAHRVDPAGYRLHVVPTDRGWMRDAAPTAVRTPGGEIVWVAWRFNAWARYDNWRLDAGIPPAVGRITGLPVVRAMRPDRPDEPLVLEGGGIETDGAGTLLVTEECFQSDVQQRNPGLDRRGYERAFADWLGIRKTIWLGCGCAGDDTHGHIDDIARFTDPRTVVLAFEPDPADANHAASVDNLRRLTDATNAAGEPLRVVRLPMPRPVWYEDQRLPASYANFYIANTVVIVPTFNDPADRVALETLAGLFPGRRVVGIHAVDLVLGQGTLHCLTQQQPAGR